jgi:hypothetical protein
MLRKKFYALLIFGSIIFLSICLSGCVNEPTIDQPQRPNSLVRFINASPSNQSAALTVYDRDGLTSVVSATIAYGSSSDYYTIPSGKRRIKLTGGLNIDTLMDITSDYRFSAIFSEYYDTTGTKKQMSILFAPEGLTYLNESGRLTAGTARIKYIEAFSSDPSVSKFDYVNNKTYTSKITYTVRLDSVKGKPEWSSIAVGTNAGYTEFTSGKSYLLSISDNYQGKVFTFTTPTLSDKTRYTLVAYGTYNGSPTNPQFTPSFKLFTDN